MHTYLFGVLANLANDDRRKVNLLALKTVSPNRSLLRLDTKRSELLEEELAHSLDILDIAATAVSYCATSTAC